MSQKPVYRRGMYQPRPCPVCFVHSAVRGECSKCGRVAVCPACTRGVRIEKGLYEEHNVDALSDRATAGRCVASGSRPEGT